VSLPVCVSSLLFLSCFLKGRWEFGVRLWVILNVAGTIIGEHFAAALLPSSLSRLRVCFCDHHLPLFSFSPVFPYFSFGTLILQQLYVRTGASASPCGGLGEASFLLVDPGAQAFDGSKGILQSLKTKRCPSSTIKYITGVDFPGYRPPPPPPHSSAFGETCAGHF